MNTIRTTLLCLLCVGLLSACGRTRPDSGPPGTGEVLPALSSRPAPTALLAPTKNVRQIHERLFQDARQHFEAHHFQKAIRELQRLLALHPQEPLQADGYWWLGQSYERVGDLEAAEQQYRQLVSATRSHPYASRSQERLQEIRGLLEEQVGPPQPTQAIRFLLNQLPKAEGFEQGIRKMKQDGVTSLLIDLGCQRMALSSFPSKNFEERPKFEQVQTLLHDYATRSHRVGLLMYVGVNLRCLGHWASGEHRSWRDQTYRMKTSTIQATERFDLFHPAYQKFLVRLLSRLCQEGIDGLVFLNDHPLGMFDGVTPIGLKRFEKQFHQVLEPRQVFHQGFNPLGGRKTIQERSDTKMAEKTDTLFWRWAGWKARERLTIVESIIADLRTHYASVQLGLELHPHGLTDPVSALAKYAEDSLDAVGRSFSFFFVRPEIDRRSTFSEQAVLTKLRRISTKTILDRLLPIVDHPRRVWVSVPSKGGERLLSQQTASTEMSLLQDFPSGIGVVHDFRAFS